LYKESYEKFISKEVSQFNSKLPKLSNKNLLYEEGQNNYQGNYIYNYDQNY